MWYDVHSKRQKLNIKAIPLMYIFVKKKKKGGGGGL